jgi:hypothetical protein
VDTSLVRAQKCNRVHALSAFDGAKRTCRAQLAVCTARRAERARRAAPHPRPHASQSDPDSAALPSSSSPSTAQDDAEAWFDAALAEAFDAHALPLLFTNLAEAVLPLPLPADDVAAEDDSAARGAAGGAAWCAVGGSNGGGGSDVVCARADVKIEGHDSESAPTALPRGLAAAAAAALFPGAARPPLALTGAVAPGCTLLTLEAVVLLPHTEEGGAAASTSAASALLLADAAGALHALLAAPHGVGAYFAARQCVRLSTRGRVATARCGVVVSDEAAPADVAAAARLPPLAALAARCDAPARVRASAPLPPRAQLRCRLHGRFLTILAASGEDDADADDASLLALAAAGEEGVALLERREECRAPPRPLLLTRHAALVGWRGCRAERRRGGYDATRRRGSRRC